MTFEFPYWLLMLTHWHAGKTATGVKEVRTEMFHRNDEANGGFLKSRYPLIIHSNGVVHYKPSSYGGTSISGTPHVPLHLEFSCGEILLPMQYGYLTAEDTTRTRNWPNILLTGAEVKGDAC